MTLSFFKVPFISLVGRQDPLLNSKSSKIEFIYQIVTSKIEFIYQISQRNNLLPIDQNVSNWANFIKKC